MNILSITLILVSVSLSVIAQILLKNGMSNPEIQQSFSSSLTAGVISIMTNFFVLGGLFAYVSSAAVWLGVLAKVDVSKAYPFVGLGFIGTMLFAYWFLNEPLTLSKIAGTILIVFGVLLISR
ncbi:MULTISPECIES: EamA family transporter [Neptunomonas]|uniref:Small multi-drug resistant family protein n=1 Tax=Neptunomonas marina TaxID=1815562 RepID=A0A437Q5L0_9GAMM|nr:EamA family transporter [Neptunomonas sp. XY-337]RVU29787.1 small multi-drug resistant family protein [Neptunomonas marina]